MDHRLWWLPNDIFQEIIRSGWWTGSSVWGLFDETDKGPFDQIHPILRAHWKKRHERWTWNFTELQSGANSNLINGRIEFRSPPDVDNWRECADWVHFTMEFVHVAIPTKVTMHRLREFESILSEYFWCFTSKSTGCYSNGTLILVMDHPGTSALVNVCNHESPNGLFLVVVDGKVYVLPQTAKEFLEPVVDSHSSHGVQRSE